MRGNVTQEPPEATQAPPEATRGEELKAEDISVKDEAPEDLNDSIASEGERQVQKAVEDIARDFKKTKTGIEEEEKQPHDEPEEEVDGPIEKEADFESGATFFTEYKQVRGREFAKKFSEAKGVLTLWRMLDRAYVKVNESYIEEPSYNGFFSNDGNYFVLIYGDNSEKLKVYDS